MSPTHKLTKNQSVVVTALKDAGRPMSAYQILDVQSVRENGLKAPLTIYRALEKLVECGLVHRIECLNAFVVCGLDAHSEPAAFMICNMCKATIEFSPKSIRSAVSRQVAERGFVMDNMHLEVSGVCAACAVG